MAKDVKILVVDDDEFLRQAIVDILEPRYSVNAACSGREAFEFVKSNPVDIVLSDVCMANGTGIELLEWIRAVHPEVPTVVLVTGYSTVTPEEAMKKGAHSVIAKPFGSQALLDAVHSIVAERKLPASRLAV